MAQPHAATDNTLQVVTAQPTASPPPIQRKVSIANDVDTRYDNLAFEPCSKRKSSQVCWIVSATITLSLPSFTFFLFLLLPFLTLHLVRSLYASHFPVLFTPAPPPFIIPLHRTSRLLIYPSFPPANLSLTAILCSPFLTFPFLPSSEEIGSIHRWPLSWKNRLY